MQSSRLVRVVFALLVLATAAAFVLTQVLKTEMPVVLRFSVAPLYFSPNGDGARDRARLGFDLSEPAEVSFSVIDMDGNDVRELVDDRELAGDARHRFAWDGRDDDGNVVPDGVYRLRVVRRKEGRRLDSFKEVVVDTTPPRVELSSAEPGVVDPSSGKRVAVTVAYRGPRTPHPEFRVWRTDDGEPRIVDRFRGDERRRGVWNGRTISGDYAVDGDYAFQARVRDRAGNEALAPPGTPSARTARPHTGVAVRRLTLEGPGGVVAAGALARLRVGPDPRPFEWTLTRLGSGRALKQGRRRGGALRVRLPTDARSGVYVVAVRSRGVEESRVAEGGDGPVISGDGTARTAGSAGGRPGASALRRRGGGRGASGRRGPVRTASWPLVVAGLPPRGVPADRPRPLVVLPGISWQGRNRFDSDLDGFADTLADARSVPAERPYAGGRLPAALARESEPLLRFLDRARLAYDLTTDLSLAARRGPGVGHRHLQPHPPGPQPGAFPFTNRASHDQKAEIETPAREDRLGRRRSRDPKLRLPATWPRCDARPPVPGRAAAHQPRAGRTPKARAASPSTAARTVSLMVNEEDHLRLQVMHSGFALDEAWERDRPASTTCSSEQRHATLSARSSAT